jgi:hypothetical protein
LHCPRNSQLHASNFPPAGAARIRRPPATVRCHRLRSRTCHATVPSAVHLTVVERRCRSGCNVFNPESAGVLQPPATARMYFDGARRRCIRPRRETSPSSGGVAPRRARRISRATLFATWPVFARGRAMSPCTADEADQSELAGLIHRRADETRRFGARDQANADWTLRLVESWNCNRPSAGRMQYSICTTAQVVNRALQAPAACRESSPCSVSR